MKKYNISEAARILNLSQGLLRHYEDLGFIDPVRDPNGYRSFQVKDIDILIGIRRFRNMGFSLKEIEEIFDSGAPEGIGVMMEEKIRDLEKELLWKKLLLKSMKETCRELKRIDRALGCFRIVRSPEALRIQNRINDRYLMENLSPESLRWVRCLPVVSISPEFPLEAVREGREEVGFGFMIPYRLAAPLNLARTPRTRYYPPRTCVTTVVYSQGRERISARHLREALAFLEKSGHTADGDPWGITLGHSRRDGVDRRFHRVFLPIKE